MKKVEKPLDFCIPLIYTFGMQKRGDEVKKKIGRPTDSPKQVQIAVRFDEETLRILDDYCEQEQISRAEGTRRAVRKLKEK